MTNTHTQRRWIQPVLTLLLMIALPACARAYPTTAVPSLPPTQPATKPPTQTITAPIITPTMAATATSTPFEDLPLLSGKDVTFEDVQFILPADLASGVDAQVVPGIDILGEMYPAHTEFTLVNYNSKNTDFEPQIQIYPVHVLGQSATQIVQALKDLLAEKPAALPRGIPILPIIPAGQLIDVHIQYLTFTNGSGIRVLTQLGQGSWPINNEGLVYIFQGLTSDDSYYVSAFLPVTASFLPDHVDDPATVPPVDGISYPQFGSSNFDKEYSDYRDAIIHKLSSTPSEAFVPSLSLLNDLLESLQINSAVTSDLTPDSVTVPCINGLPTRLLVGAFAYVNPEPPLPNNLRSDAGKNHSLIGEIQPGQALKILDGPQCADGWVWWKVLTIESELVGWTAEGDQQNYWLIPCKSQGECGP